MTKVQKLHAEVDCIGCDTCHSVSTSNLHFLRDDSRQQGPNQRMRAVERGLAGSGMQSGLHELFADLSSTYLAPFSNTTAINIVEEVRM